MLDGTLLRSHVFAHTHKRTHTRHVTRARTHTHTLKLTHSHIHTHTHTPRSLIHVVPTVHCCCQPQGFLVLNLPLSAVLVLWDAYISRGFSFHPFVCIGALLSMPLSYFLALPSPVVLVSRVSVQRHPSCCVTLRLPLQQCHSPRGRFAPAALPTT